MPRHSMHKPHTYTIDFPERRPCPAGVIAEMARYDWADITAGIDGAGQAITAKMTGDKAPTHFRSVTFTSHRGFKPTMARWASFAVGARLRT